MQALGITSLGAFSGLENMLGAGVGQVAVPGELRGVHAQEYSQPTGNESWRVNDPAFLPREATSMNYGLYVLLGSLEG